jgi:hypothetical protein
VAEFSQKKRKEKEMTKWLIYQDGAHLIFRDKSAEGVDHRIAFGPNAAKNIGSGSQHLDEPHNVIVRFEHWVIQEETGVLIIRDLANPGDNRYAFFPGGAQDFGHGSPTTNESKVLFKGNRWEIRDENGILVFRDTKSEGDSRYAFYPGNYVDM